MFGATGKTGRHVWRNALERGHRVTAIGRSVDQLADGAPDVHTAKGDVFDPAAVAAAVAGHDAAIVCLGSTGLRDTTTLSTGTENVVDAMTDHDVKRLVVMSASGVGESRKQIPLTSRLLFSTMLRSILADHRRQEEIVEHSPLDWTIVRAGVLKDDPATGMTTATNTGRITRINREDVAAFLVDQLDDTIYLRRAISVTS